MLQRASRFVVETRGTTDRTGCMTFIADKEDFAACFFQTALMNHVGIKAECQTT